MVAARKAQGAQVTLVGMSYGAVTVAEALAAGARPDKVVFAAGGLLPPGTPNGSVQGALGTPAILPRTLVLHHRQDGCRLTPPEAVVPFVAWTGGRARARWIDGGGGDGFPCRPNTPHTFTGRTRAAADAIIQFARGK
jgi:pimeloyl-ACP methyl ester carboxylesterase